MNRIVPVLVAASLAASGTVLAQNTPNNNGLTTGLAPGNSSGAVTPGIGPGASPSGPPPTIGGGAPGTAPGIAPNGAAPTVGNTAVGGGMAPDAMQTMNGNQRPIDGAASTTANTQNRTSQAPVAGANSFTVGQARARIQHDGFTQVSGLHKDRQGVWRGKAMKDGQSVGVALDYQGKIFGQ